MPNVSGRVVFDENRTATINLGDTGLENIPVVLQDIATGNRLIVLTDFSGSYTFTNVPAGNYRIVEAFGTGGGIPTPGDFSGASVGPVPVGADPPITSAINPPPGATDIDSLSPNTLFITVAAADITDQNFLDGPVIYTDIGEILDSCTTIDPNNLITAADNGRYGSEPAGSPINTAPGADPYPGISTGFVYTVPAPPGTRPFDGSYTIQNISGDMSINGNTWWRIADHTTGDETGRFQAIGGSNPGAVFFQETINVTPNTNYLFSAWILNLIRRNGFAEPRLGVEILDQGGGILYQQTLGSAIPASILAPEWKEIGTALNSQGNNQLTVRFTSEGPAATGNDYAIDDIAFRELSIPTFTPVKSISKNIADVGEIVTYTITLENDCENPLTNVTFQDTVPNGLTFEPGTVNINGVNNPTFDPNAGFNVPDIAGLNTTIITFDARVDSIPVPNPIDNGANMTYEYTPITGGITSQFNENTNLVPLQVNNAELTPTKIVDLSIADIGDALTYTISFTNTGNVDAENVVVTDSIPNGTSYIPGSLSSTVSITGDPTTQINLTNPVASGETVTISFRVNIDSLPNPNPIPNTANVDYEYTVDPADPPIEVNIDTNTVFTQVNTASLTPIKGVNKDFAEVGEEITYTISFTNTGNVDAENVVITDVIPNGTSYVSGSVNSNVAFTGEPTSSISITNPVASGETVNLTFRVLIIRLPVPNPIPNTANVDYEYIVDPANPPIEENIDTNTVFTQVNIVDLNPTKSVDLAFASVGDELTYIISFTNTGNISAENVVITDVIPNGTSYVAGSLNINVPSSGDPTSNITLTNPVAPGETITIEFRVSVDTVPNPNPIPNSATVDYEYSVDPNESNRDGSEITNTVFTQVNSAVIVPVKSTSAIYADVGDIVTHTISFTNTGNTEALNVVITDVIPNGTSFVDGSLNLNVPFTGDLVNGVNLTNPVQSGESIILTYDLLVEEIPVPNPFENTATIDYSYILDPSEPEVDASIDTNTTMTEVRSANIEPPVKTANPDDVVEVGEEIEYTITFTNTGNVDATNVTIVDPIRNGTSLVGGSLTINVPYTGDLDNGILLTNPVSPGETITVSYRLLVEEVPNPNPITNIARITYEYIVDPDNPPVEKETESNEVEVLVNPVTIEKICTPDEVTLGEIINYNFTIRNTSDITINNIVFFDTLPEGVEFVEGSFRGALSSNVTSEDLINGVALGSINPRKNKNISFKVRVVGLPCSLEFNNSARITYDLETSDGEIINEETTSNECSVSVKKTSFKQAFSDGTLILPSDSADIESIISFEVSVESEDYKVIDSPTGISNENQNLTGKKIMICTTLGINITYVGSDDEQTVYSLEYEISPCEFIVVPNVDNYDCLINLITTIEDIFYAKIDDRTIFYNITYFTESGI